MRNVRSTVGLVLMSLTLTCIALTGCEPAAENSASTANQNEPTPIDKIAPEGAIDRPIVCVSEIAKDANSHAGRVAVRGVVSKVFADRRAFTVANIVEGATCCATGCGEHSIPARVPTEQFVGDLPEFAERVILVGEVVPGAEGAGFEFNIEEVWADGKLLMKKQV